MSSLERDLRNLSAVGFSLWVDELRRFVVVEGVQLPRGYDRNTIPLLVELPTLYPMVPPGVGGSSVYVPSGLRYMGASLRDVHPNATPSFITLRWSDWAWLCYESITTWNPLRDDLIAFVEMVRSDLTNPKTI